MKSLINRNFKTIFTNISTFKPYHIKTSFKNKLI